MQNKPSMPLFRAFPMIPQHQLVPFVNNLQEVNVRCIVLKVLKMVWLISLHEFNKSQHIFNEMTFNENPGAAV